MTVLQGLPCSCPLAVLGDISVLQNLHQLGTSHEIGTWCQENCTVFCSPLRQNLVTIEVISLLNKWMVLCYSNLYRKSSLFLSGIYLSKKSFILLVTLSGESSVLSIFKNLKQNKTVCDLQFSSVGLMTNTVSFRWFSLSLCIWWSCRLNLWPTLVLHYMRRKFCHASQFQGLPLWQGSMWEEPEEQGECWGQLAVFLSSPRPQPVA